MAAAFIAMAVTFGVAYSFGAFFTPMAAEFHAGKAATSFAFGLTVFLWFGLGGVTGWLGDRFGPRPVVLAGAVALGVGLWLTGRAPSLTVGYVTYSAGVGIGVACGYVPMVAAAGAWFERRQPMAIGVAVSGIGAGTLAGPLISAWLIDRFGWRQADVYEAVGAFVLLVLAALAGSTPKHLPRGSGGALGQALRSRQFQVLYLATLLQGLPLFTFFAYIAPYAVTLGTGAIAAAGLVSVVGIGSTLGRLLLGVVAGRVGRMPTFVLCMVGMALSYLIWLLAPGYWALALTAFLLGFAYGTWVAVTPTVYAELFGNQGLGSVTGVAYTAAGLGALFGPSLTGAIVDAGYGYRPGIGLGLALQLAAVALVVFFARRPRGVPALNA